MPSEHTQSENLLNLNDSDLQALFEYKENLPSFESTQDINQISESNFDTIKDACRDIDCGELAQSIEQKLNSIQASDQLSKINL